MGKAGERIIEGAKEALAIARGEQPAARIHVQGHSYVPEQDLRQAVERVIAHLTSEFIVEECVGNLTEGCLSCEMIETRASLRRVLEIMNENWTFTPAQLDAHTRPHQPRSRS